MYPIDYVPDLAAARLEDILIPGENEESDDALRARYFESLEFQAFGGNIADYKNKVELLPGVGAAKVIPAWNGGGTVKVLIISSEWGAPSADLVQRVQEAIDPAGTQGSGLGLAPIGHTVTVEGVASSTINVSFSLAFGSGGTWSGVQAAVKTAVQSYFAELSRAWADTDTLVIRVSQIETRILGVPGVIDITNTKINGSATNLSLESNKIPVLGVITNGT